MVLRRPGNCGRGLWPQGCLELNFIHPELSTKAVGLIWALGAFTFKIIAMGINPTAAGLYFFRLKKLMCGLHVQRPPQERRPFPRGSYPGKLCF